MSELPRDQIYMRQQVLMKSAIYNDLKMRGDKQNFLQFIVQTKRRKVSKEVINSQLIINLIYI